MFGCLRSGAVGHTAKRNRLTAPELLECRELLTASPLVTGVEVFSSSWSAAFTSALQDANQSGIEGFAIPLGSSAQSTALTWTNLDQIKIRFSQDVKVDAADLSISGVNQLAYAFDDFHYDPQGRVATWTLSAPLAKDRLRLDLDADGLDPVRNLNGVVLDGEWTNNVSVVSGNGTAGGDFHFNLNVLPCDVNNSGSVSSFDYVQIRQLESKTVGSAGYIAKRDVDGSGIINLADWQAAVDRYFDTLPSGTPAGTNNDAPTTSGLTSLEISDAAIDTAISLASHFGDVENGGGGLTYSILSNTNPGLFDTASINPATKSLVINTANGASGRATLVIRATDAGGLFVDTPITVDVDHQNSPPEIHDFRTQYYGDGMFLVTGYVTDPDDDVSKLLVRFSNVFETRAAVDDEGYFQFSVMLTEPVWDLEYAITWDPHGLASDEVFDEVYFI